MPTLTPTAALERLIAAALDVPGTRRRCAPPDHPSTDTTSKRIVPRGTSISTTAPTVASINPLPTGLSTEMRRCSAFTSIGPTSVYSST